MTTHAGQSSSTSLGKQSKIPTTESPSRSGSSGQTNASTPERSPTPATMRTSTPTSRREKAAPSTSRDEPARCHHHRTSSLTRQRTPTMPKSRHSRSRTTRVNGGRSTATRPHDPDLTADMLRTTLYSSLARAQYSTTARRSRRAAPHVHPAPQQIREPPTQRPQTSQHRRNETIRWAAETPIHWVCPTQSFEELRAASRINSDHYNADQQCIDFVINHCSDFQAAAAQAYGMTGKSQAAAVLTTRICNEISRHWPQLSNACERKITDELSA